MSDDMSSSVRNEPRSRDLSGIDEVAKCRLRLFCQRAMFGALGRTGSAHLVA